MFKYSINNIRIVVIHEWNFEFSRKKREKKLEEKLRNHAVQVSFCFILISRSVVEIQGFKVLETIYRLNE